ncbi:MAG: Uma2 family endonuclease [Cyclobacteriaceae bacterium]
MIFPATLKGRYIERMTDGEFFYFCQDNKDFKFERTSEGQIILMSPTGFITGDRNRSIIKQISNWNDQYKLGRAVDSDTGFYLSNGAMRNPDSAWVSNEKLKNISSAELEGFPHFCPDFIVELRSKGDTLKELKAKMNEWMDNGCKLGWLIDADEEKVYVYYNSQETVHNGFNNPLSGEPVLPGFNLILSELRV